MSLTLWRWNDPEGEVMLLQSFVFPAPPSLVITAMSVVSFIVLPLFGLSEARGKHLQYSKFWNVGLQNAARKQIKLSGRCGMLVLYTPAFLAGLASFWLLPDEGLRFLLLRSALTIHFLKRIFEVLFVHKYSSRMTIDAVIPITSSYFTSTASMIYAQHLIQGSPEPAVDLKYPGIVLFLLGICGNFYHHYLLSKLRSESDKSYKIPSGGLFDLVICPHYLFELFVFFGISFISQTFYAFSFAIGTTFYLMGRSYATRKWYLSKFENFPRHVKALIPYVF